MKIDFNGLKKALQFLKEDKAECEDPETHQDICDAYNAVNIAIGYLQERGVLE